jgi:hypothetical protein
MLGSRECNYFLQSLIRTSNKEILTTEIVKIYASLMWKKAIIPHCIIAAYFLSFTIVFTSTFVVGLNDESDIVVLMFWAMTFVAYLIWQMLTMRGRFFANIWNSVELVRMILVIFYLTYEL